MEGQGLSWSLVRVKLKCNSEEEVFEKHEGEEEEMGTEGEKMWEHKGENQNNLTHIPHPGALLGFLLTPLPLLTLSPSLSFSGHVASVSGCGQAVSSVPAGCADLPHDHTARRKPQPK